MDSALGDLLTPDFLIRETVKVHEALSALKADVGPEVFTPRSIRTENGQQRIVIEADIYAEYLLAAAFQGKAKSRVRIIKATELDEQVSLAKERRICIIIDAIDGADQYRHGFSGWCSAILAFDPNKRTILAAFIAAPKRRYLYYTSNDGGSFRQRLTYLYAPNLPSTVRVVSTPKPLDDLVIAIETNDRRPLQDAIPSLRGLISPWVTQTVEPRSTNLLMAELAEGSIDVVVAHRSNTPHDMLVGALIAAEAGAFVGNFKGEICDLNALTLSLFQPGAPIGRGLLVGRNRQAVDAIISAGFPEEP